MWWSESSNWQDFRAPKVGFDASHTYLAVKVCAALPHMFFGPVTTRIFLRHTTDIRSDSGCPTPCDRCDTLHYRTPHTQLGQVSRCFPFLLQLKYFSDILRTSDSAQWPRRFCIIGQLVPNSAEPSNGFPFCYNSNISLIYCGRWRSKNEVVTPTTNTSGGA